MNNDKQEFLKNRTISEKSECPKRIEKILRSMITGV